MKMESIEKKPFNANYRRNALTSYTYIQHKVFGYRTYGLIPWHDYVINYIIVLWKTLKQTKHTPWTYL